MGLLRAGDWGSGDSESKSQGYSQNIPEAMWASRDPDVTIGELSIQLGRCSQAFGLVTTVMRHVPCISSDEHHKPVVLSQATACPGCLPGPLSG